MARMGDLAGVDDYEQDELLAPPAQPRPLNMLGDAFYGLGRSLSGPAANPIQPAQDAAYGAFKGMTVDPVVEAYNAVKGRMTEDEQRNMLFGAAIGMLPMGRAAKGAAPAGIKVFHSSPHDFERFDASKIGTGEGAQVYGYGHYFAENPKVSGQGGEYWKQFLSRYDMPEGYAARELMHSKFDRARALENIQKDISGIEWMGPENTNLNDLLAIRELLKSGKPVGPRTYEVNLKARPEEFLDWDRPLREQSARVQSIPGIAEAARTEAYNRALAATNKPRADQLWSMVKNPLDATGEFAFSQLAPRRSSPEASKMLYEAGIPGIRYLDQGSRQLALDQAAALKAAEQMRGKGVHGERAWLEEAERLKQTPLTSNYVMFPGTEGLIDITKKYAIPAAVLGGLAAQDRYETQ